MNKPLFVRRVIGDERTSDAKECPWRWRDEICILKRLVNFLWPASVG